MKLYSESLRHHGQQPLYCGTLVPCDVRVRRTNPVCGDVITWTLVLKDGYIHQLAWSGHCCLLGTASASIVGEIVSGKSLELARVGYQVVQQYLKTFAPLEAPFSQLQAFAAMVDFPMRRACVELPWQTLNDAFQLSSKQR
jgi:nitrogen fixation protein NifU and related proteins